MKLTESQKKFLRGRGHKLRPVVQIGDAGLSDAVLREFAATIAHHELIKVRIRAADREQRDRLIGELCRRGEAQLITRIGNVALLYRPADDESRMRLPAG